MRMWTNHSLRKLPMKRSQNALLEGTGRCLEDLDAAGSSCKAVVLATFAIRATMRFFNPKVVSKSCQARNPFTIVPDKVG